jgi:S1-C subfamily serine protease
VIRRAVEACDDGRMTSSEYATAMSTALADAVEGAAPAVVQVQGRRRPASGLIYAREVVLTMTRALGREDGLHVRDHAGQLFDAQLAGWDPATSLAVLRVPGLSAAPIAVSKSAPRVGHMAIAIARSWSNSVTASAGVISVIAGPLPTGRRRAIEQVLRTTAPMHDGFAGGAFVDTAGALVGVTTAAEIRGLGVVIPASIAWPTAAHILEHGRTKRGYLGIAGQNVPLPEAQAALAGRSGALLVIGVTAGSPAAGAGVLVGDVLIELDGQAVTSTDELLDLLSSIAVGKPVAAKVLRGAAAVDLSITIGERPAS